MKDNLKFTLLAIGIIVIFFIMGREIIETSAKLRKTQNLIVQQKKEKAWLQDELKTTRGELANTSRNLRTCQGKLDFVNKKISVLRGSNGALIIAREGLEHKIATLQEEKRVMEAKFRSLNELKKAIRERDNYRCQICGIPQEEYMRNLDVHHIDSDKFNCNPYNLITLCAICHTKLEHNNTVSPIKIPETAGNPERAICNEAPQGERSETIMGTIDNKSIDGIVRTCEESQKNGCYGHNATS